MNDRQKFTPVPMVEALNRLHLAGMILWPALSFWFGYRALKPLSSTPDWLLFFAGLLALTGFLVFAVIQFKEFAPESAPAAFRLALAPYLLALPAAWAGAGGFSLLLNAAGILMFTGMWLALLLVFSAGTHLAPRNETSPPGESALAWRPEGHSLWSDPDFSPMARWTLALVFLVPGLLMAAALNFTLLKAVDTCCPILSAIWWILSLLAVAWLHTRQLARLAGEGRIFGPGKNAFH